MKDAKGNPLATGDKVVSSQSEESYLIEVSDGIGKVLPNLPIGKIDRLNASEMASSYWVKVGGKS